MQQPPPPQRIRRKPPPLNPTGNPGGYSPTNKPQYMQSQNQNPNTNLQINYSYPKGNPNPNSQVAPARIQSVIYDNHTNPAPRYNPRVSNPPLPMNYGQQPPMNEMTTNSNLNPQRYAPGIPRYNQPPNQQVYAHHSRQASSHLNTSTSMNSIKVNITPPMSQQPMLNKASTNYYSHPTHGVNINPSSTVTNNYIPQHRPLPQPQIQPSHLQQSAPPHHQQQQQQQPLPPHYSPEIIKAPPTPPRRQYPPPLPQQQQQYSPEVAPSPPPRRALIQQPSMEVINPHASYLPHRQLPQPPVPSESENQPMPPPRNYQRELIPPTSTSTPIPSQSHFSQASDISSIHDYERRMDHQSNPPVSSSNMSTYSFDDGRGGGGSSINSVNHRRNQSYSSSMKEAGSIVSTTESYYDYHGNSSSNSIHHVGNESFNSDYRAANTSMNSIKVPNSHESIRSNNSSVPNINLIETDHEEKYLDDQKKTALENDKMIHQQNKSSSPSLTKVDDHDTEMNLNSPTEIDLDVSEIEINTQLLHLINDDIKEMFDKKFEEGKEKEGEEEGEGAFQSGHKSDYQLSLDFTNSSSSRSSSSKNNSKISIQSDIKSTTDSLSELSPVNNENYESKSPLINTTSTSTNMNNGNRPMTSTPSNKSVSYDYTIYSNDGSPKLSDYTYFNINKKAHDDEMSLQSNGSDVKYSVDSVSLYNDSFNTTNDKQDVTNLRRHSISNEDISRTEHNNIKKHSYLSLSNEYHSGSGPEYNNSNDYQYGEDKNLYRIPSRNSLYSLSSVNESGKKKKK